MTTLMIGGSIGRMNYLLGTMRSCGLLKIPRVRATGRDSPVRTFRAQREQVRPPAELVSFFRRREEHACGVEESLPCHSPVF